MSEYVCNHERTPAAAQQAMDSYMQVWIQEELRARKRLLPAMLYWPQKIGVQGTWLARTERIMSDS